MANVKEFSLKMNNVTGENYLTVDGMTNLVKGVRIKTTPSIPLEEFLRCHRNDFFTAPQDVEIHVEVVTDAGTLSYEHWADGSFHNVQFELSEVERL